jgi:hypothetical protein
MSILPQIIVIALSFIGIGIEIAKDGQMKEPKKYNAKVHIIATIITLSLLYWGGFFDNIIK